MWGSGRVANDKTCNDSVVTRVPALGDLGTRIGVYSIVPRFLSFRSPQARFLKVPVTFQA